MVQRSNIQVKEDVALLNLPPNTTPTPAQIQKSKEMRKEIESGSTPAQPTASQPTTSKPTKSKPTTSKPAVSKTPVPAKRTVVKQPAGVSSTLPNATTSKKASKLPEPVEDDEKTAEKPYHNPRFDRKDLERLIEEISKPKVNNTLFGSGSKPSLGLSRNGAWTTVASMMNVFHNDNNRTSTKSSNEQMKLKGTDLMKRWRAIKERYMAAKKLFKSTGEGLEAGDEMDTLKKKAEKICPCYELLNELYGHKANVSPHALLDSMNRIEGDIETASENDSDDDSVVIEGTQAGNQVEDDAIDPILNSLAGDDVDWSALLSDSNKQINVEPDSNEDLKDLSDDGLAESLVDPILDATENSPEFPPLPSPITPPEIDNTPIEPNQTSSTNKKRKPSNAATDDRPAKPLASIDESNQKRRKGPASFLMDNRDDKKYVFLDSKFQAKNENDLKKLDAENHRAEESLTWDKTKYERDDENMKRREERSMDTESKRTLIEERRVQVEADKNEGEILWAREKFNLETSQAAANQQAAASTSALRARLDVMENCRKDGMSVDEISAYLKIVFGE